LEENEIIDEVSAKIHYTSKDAKERYHKTLQRRGEELYQVKHNCEIRLEQIKDKLENKQKKTLHANVERNRCYYRMWPEETVPVLENPDYCATENPDTGI
jgi:hypothetical protein